MAPVIDNLDHISRTEEIRLSTLLTSNHFSNVHFSPLFKKITTKNRKTDSKSFKLLKVGKITLLSLNGVVQIYC